MPGGWTICQSQHVKVGSHRDYSIIISGSHRESWSLARESRKVLPMGTLQYLIWQAKQSSVGVLRQAANDPADEDRSCKKCKSVQGRRQSSAPIVKIFHEGR